MILKVVRKITSTVLCALIVFGFLLLLPCRPAVAKSSNKMKLPEKVVVDYKDTKTGEWKENYTVFYKYNKKGDLIQIDLTTPDDGGEKWIPTYITYRYTKKGVKKSAVATDSYGIYVYEFDKKGRLTNVTTKEVGWSKIGHYITSTTRYKYDNKGNISSRTWSTDDKTYDVKKATEKYTTKRKKGKVVSIKAARTGWLGLKYTEISKYNSKGLLSAFKRTDGDGKLMDEWTYKYDMSKDGKYVQCRYSNENDAEQRRTYTYGKTKASRSVYLNILNLDERSIIKNNKRNQM